MRIEGLGTIKTDHNNWVIPGYVMAGPYPGQDGLNYPTEDSACTNLQGILADGINVFVSLCHELPPQTTEAPGTTTCIHYFPRYTNYAYLIARYRLSQAHMTYEHFKIKDQDVPSHEQLLAILTCIMTHLAQGKKVFVHCAGGHGRTGLVLATLLLALYNIDDEYALYFTQHAHNLRRIQDKRCAHFIIPVRSPNSPVQFQMAREFSHFVAFLSALPL